MTSDRRVYRLEWTRTLDEDAIRQYYRTGSGDQDQPGTQPA